MTTEVDNKTNEQLILLNKRLYRMVSTKQTFLRGIIWGLGSALGATVVAAVALAILARFIDQVDEVPVIEDVVHGVDLSSEPKMIPVSQ